MSDRKFKESPLKMGEDEIIAFALTVPPTWGSSPASPTNVLKNEAGTDVSSSNLEGDPSVSGSVITTSKVKSLTDGQRYRLEVKWTDTGNTLEAFAWIIAEE
jgi:hypothetical protein